MSRQLKRIGPVVIPKLLLNMNVLPKSIVLRLTRVVVLQLQRLLEIGDIGCGRQTIIAGFETKLWVGKKA